MGKLLSVRRRRFPSTRFMSVIWVPRFLEVVCHVGIIINVGLLLLPYRLTSHFAIASDCGQAYLEQGHVAENRFRRLCALGISGRTKIRSNCGCAEISSKTKKQS